MCVDFKIDQSQFVSSQYLLSFLFPFYCVKTTYFFVNSTSLNSLGIWLYIPLNIPIMGPAIELWEAFKDEVESRRVNARLSLTQKYSGMISSLNFLQSLGLATNALNLLNPPNTVQVPVFFLGLPGLVRPPLELCIM